jgi:catechol 2,3-dioxygenase-like lactoylglutathione lyase family enzyme
VKTFLYHVQINVGDAARSIPFYRALFAYLEYTTIMDTQDLLGVSNGTTDFWMIDTPSERRTAPFHRKNTGLNHVAFGVGHREDVDRFVEEFLKPRGIAALYDSPRDYPEYRAGYYGVFFEDPDRLKLEVVYVPGITDRFTLTR